MKVLDLDLGPSGSLDAVRIVAVLARQSLVFAGQCEVGQRVMLESCLVEFGDLKFLAVVFQVAASAVRLAACDIERTGVIAMLLLDPFGDLGMAVQAFETAFPDSEVVAGGALGGAFKVLVNP